MNTVGNRKRFTIKSVLKALGNHPKLGLERINYKSDLGYYIFIYNILLNNLKQLLNLNMNTLLMS